MNNELKILLKQLSIVIHNYIHMYMVYDIIFNYLLFNSV